MKRATRKTTRAMLGLGIFLLLSAAILPGSSAQTLEPAHRNESIFSPIGGATMADPTGSIQLDSSSQPATSLTKEDYFDSYTLAAGLLDVGIQFRSRELQRLDPTTCVADQDNSDACAFSVTAFTVDGIKNNYLDFKDGRLFWRFCADYDEPFVGLGNVPQGSDDPQDLLKLNAYGYCPEWSALSNQQKTLRVASWQNEDLDRDNGNEKQIDIRNQMVDAQRIFGVLAVAEPANLVFDGQNGGTLLDLITVQPDGTITAGGDGKPDRVRDLGIYGLLLSTREIASVHLILGNEFMVDALRFPFSTPGTDTEQLVKDEQAKLNRALRQYELATDIFFAAMNYNLRTVDQNRTFIGDYFSDREFQLFTAASERTVTALGEIAKRDRLLGTDGDTVAIQRLEEAMLDQYLQGLALAYQATRQREDDPSTPDTDESQSNFLNNGGTEILNNIRKLMQQTQNIRAGLNPLGYDEAFVPLKDFEDLLELTCGGRTTCTDNAGLLNSARQAVEGEDGLLKNQRLFDEKFDALKSALTSLEFDYDIILTEICGESTDTDGDGLKDFTPCGFDDANNNGRIDDPSETFGLMGGNFWKLIEAEEEISLAVRQAENLVEEIRIEEERAGRVIDVILGEGQRISAYELAVGKLNAVKTTSSVVSSESAIGYLDLNNQTQAGTKVNAKTTANPLACLFGGCTLENETWFQTTFNLTVGGGVEWATVSASETVWSPNDARIAVFSSVNALKTAEANAQIEGANSAAEVRNLLLKQSALLAQIEISQLQFNQVVNERNMLLDRYALALTQRASTVAAIQESYLSKPYFRLFRDGAALEAARTLEQAQQAAYLTAKALEYYTLSPVPYLHELYRVRNPKNLRAFLNKLVTDYAPIAPEKFSKVTYRLSLAEDIFGLTDANLNPDGLLSAAEVDALRAQLFQQILTDSRINNPETGFDRIVIPFSTSLDDPKFLNGVFNNRITRTSTTDPGCTAGGGCRGVWLNIVTNQAVDDLEGDFPKLTLSHAGLATYRNGNLQVVSYDPGPALMVGRTLPDGFGGSGREAALVSAHVNLPLGAEPNTNLAYDNFYNLSVATTQWALEFDLTNPLVNTQLDISKITDIELRMDTAYVTPNVSAAYAALDVQRVEAETAGQPVPSSLRQELARLEAALPTLDVQAADLSAETLGRAKHAADPNRYVGTVSIVEPVPLGTMDMGFSLEIGGDNAVTGSLCLDCGALFQADGAVPITGAFNPADRTLTFSTTAMAWDVAGRNASRTWSFTGTLSAPGDVIEGTFVETTTGFIARPVVSEGAFLVSRPTAVGALSTQKQLLVSAPSALERNSTAPLTVLIRDSAGAPVSGVGVTLAVNRGALSTLNGTTDGNGQVNLSFTASNELGKVTLTVQADGLTQTRAIYVVSGALPQTGADAGRVNAGAAVVIDVLANDVAVEGQLDPTSVTIIEQPRKGTAEIDATTGAITYRAALTSSGIDTFTYTVKDTNGVTSAATTVTVTILGGSGDGRQSYLPLIATQK